MTTAVLDAAPAADPVAGVPEPRAGEAPDQPPAPDRPSLLGRLAALAASVKDVAPYAGYVGYFVGAGLVSGGIVHYPLAPTRYATIAGTGIVVFLLATLFNEVLLAAERLPRLRLVRVVVASLLLSLGIGMLSGGIQHFQDFPARAATLIPVGLVVSYAAFQVRNADRPRAALLRPATVLVFLLAVALVPGLRALVPAAPAVAHGHGETPTATPPAAGVPAAGHAPAVTTQPVQVPSTSADLDAALADLLARLDSVRRQSPASG